MGRIHHTIRSIKRDFTPEEWTVWCNDKRKAGKFTVVVYEYDGYQFNDCDVCVNPTTVEVCQGVSVEVAQSREGKWSVGYTHLHGGSPCMYGSREQASQDEAILHGLQLLRELLQRDIDWYGNNDGYGNEKKRCVEALNATEAEIRNRMFTQLTLF